MAGPVYTYTLCTPDAASPMNQTQPLLLANFRAINELFEVNHVGWFDTNVSTNFGGHNYLSIPNQTSYPSTAATEVTMFTYATGDPNPCELFIRYPSNGDVLQISNAVSSAPGTSGGTAAQGYVTFDSGIIFRWGLSTLAVNKNNSIPPTNNITLDVGSLYTINQFPAAIGPVTTGAQLPIGIAIYFGTGQSGNTSTLEYIPLAFNGAVTTTSSTEFNYLLVGM